MLWTLCICLKIERPCQAFLAWSLALPLSLPLSFLFPALSCPPPSSLSFTLSSATSLSYSFLSFFSSFSYLLFFTFHSSAFLYFALCCALYLPYFSSLHVAIKGSYRDIQHFSMINAVQWVHSTPANVTLLCKLAWEVCERTERKCLVRVKWREWSRATERNIQRCEMTREKHIAKPH